MAAGIPKKRLWDKATCFLCLNFFADPMMLECGHSFCKNCIDSHWEEPPTHPRACPQCQETVQCQTLWPNKQLSNIVDVARKLNDEVMEKAMVWGVCEHHQEPLVFFCKDDEACFCTVCEKFRRHKEHRAVLVGVAVKEYKGQIYTCLENLRKKKEELLICRDNTEMQSQELANMIDREKQRTVASFRELHQFLEEEEKLTLAQMEEVNKEVEQKRDKEIARLLEELASLENSIRELEDKCQCLPGDLLKDVISTLQRCEQKQNEKFENPAAFPASLKWKIWEMWDMSSLFQHMLKDFEGVLKTEYQLHKENVTLDPQTAHPRLLISEEGKCLTLGDEAQCLPPSSLRFVHYMGVLGSKWFQSGRHCWEVNVDKEEGWAIGICVLPLQFDNNKPLGPESGVWGIGKWEGHYRAVNHPHHSPLPLSEEPRKIRVLMNYMGQQVAFFDADTAAFLHMFSLPIYLYNTFFPFFALWTKSCLRLDP